MKSKVVLLVLACSLAVGGVGWGASELLRGGSAAPLANNDPKPLTVIPQLQEKTEGGQAKQDPAGDRLPSGAVARLGTTNWRHATVVRFAGFLPDGKAVVTADDETIRVWEFPSGKEIRRIDLPFAADPTRRGPGGVPLGVQTVVSSGLVALSHDGNIVACYFDNKAILFYEVATGKLSSVAFPTFPYPFAPHFFTGRRRTGMPR